MDDKHLTYLVRSYFGQSWIYVCEIGRQNHQQYRYAWLCAKPGKVSLSRNAKGV